MTCQCAVRTFDSNAVRTRAALLAIIGLSVACKGEPAATTTAALSTSTAPGEAPDDAVDPPRPPQPGPETDFVQLRSLLRQDPQSPARAFRLYPMVKSICDGDARRGRLVDDAETMVASGVDDDTKARQRRSAIAVVDHVATACWRTTPTVAYSLLDDARPRLNAEKQLSLVAARLRAAAGELDKALAHTKVAREAGSIHAIALQANLQADVARGKSVGYTAGMLDPALETVAVEPDNNWPLIDLTAVLSTRASLLSERAIWEAGADVGATLKRARVVYRRLAEGPFVEPSRRHAADMLCFDSVEIGNDDPEGCTRAADKFGILGAAMLTNKDITKAPFDTKRWQDIIAVRTRIEAMPEGAAVVLVVHGAESELMTWARPTAQVLTYLTSKKPTLIVLDRTNSTRASAMVDRILQLARAKPAERIRAGNEVFAMPCLTAVLAGRKTPQACPFDAERVARLRALKDFGLAVLVGRDLDGELDDARLYELPAILMSYRQPIEDIPMAAHLKSLSDAWILSLNAGELITQIAERAPKK